MNHAGIKGESRSRAGRRWILFVCVLLLQLAPTRGEVEREIILPPYQNQALRDYFLSHLTGESWAWIHAGFLTRHADPVELNRRVDLLIGEFTKELVAKLNSLEKDLKQVEDKRLELLSLPEETRIPALRQWRVLLNKLENQADDLRDYLAPVFFSLESKCDFEAVVTEADFSNLFDRQVVALRREASRARGLIRDLLLQPTFVVDVDTLRQGNMLIALHRTEKLAKGLADFLKKKS